MKKIIHPILLFLICSSAFAQDGTKEGVFESQDISDLMIKIDTGMEIIIRPNIEGKINYLYSFSGNKEAYDHLLKNFDPVFSTNGKKGLLEIKFPNHKNRKSKLVIKKHTLSLEVPRSIFLDLISEYSTVSINGFDKGIKIRNKSGKVSLNDIAQNVTIDNPYGIVDVTNLQGELSISNRSANITVKDLVGKINIDAEYSKVNLSKIHGDISIVNRSSIINAFAIKGNFSAKGSYLEYELTNIDGDVKIENKSGDIAIENAHSLHVEGEYINVTATDIYGNKGVNIFNRSAKIRLENIKNSVTIAGSYLNLDMKQISGYASINNRSGKVTINDLGGYLKILGEYMPINVLNFKGNSIEIENKSDPVFIEALNKLSNIRIDAEFNDIELVMNQVYEGEVYIESRYGDIDSEILLNNSTIESKDEKTIHKGIAGKTAGKLVIKNNGNIIIRVNN